MSMRRAIGGLLLLTKISVSIFCTFISNIHFWHFRMKTRVVKKIQISFEKALPVKVSG